MDLHEIIGARPGKLTARLATNTLVQVVGSLLATTIGFFTFVAVTRGLGPEAYGDFTAAMAFLFIPIAVADVGLFVAVLREISATPERTENAMRASLPLRALVSAVVVAIAVGIGVALPLNGRTTTAVLIGSLGAFLTLMSLALLPVLQARLQMHWAVAGSLAGRLVALAATLGVLAAGLGFRSIVWAWVAGLAVTFLVHLVAVRRIVPLRPVVDMAYWRTLLAGSLVIGLAIAISQIYFRIDMLLLALIRPSTEVGYYGAAYKFVELAMILGAAASASMFPPLSNLLAKRDPRAKELVQKTFDVLLAGAVFFGIVMLVFSEEIIELTAGPEFEDAASALQLLAPWALFGFVNGAFWNVLLAAGRDRLLLVCASGVLVINVGLNLALLPAYGYKAAAVVAVVTEALVFIPIALVIREIGLFPDLGYAPSIALAGAVLTAILWLVPGPAFVIGTAGAAVYAAILLAAPGAVRDVARSLLPDRTPLLRTRS